MLCTNIFFLFFLCMNFKVHTSRDQVQNWNWNINWDLPVRWRLRLIPKVSDHEKRTSWKINTQLVKWLEYSWNIDSTVTRQIMQLQACND